MDYMELRTHDFIGVLGVLMVVGSYLMLQLRRIDPRSLAYSLLNGLGALFILVSLWFEFNLSAAIIESFWLVISCIGVIQWARERSNRQGSF